VQYAPNEEAIPSSTQVGGWRNYLELHKQTRRGIEIMNEMFIWLLWLIIPAGSVGAQSLDYQTYRTTVEPIFLKKRPPHARCVVCHVSANHAFHLEPLNRGATTWTEAQSRKNFETVSHLVKPGAPHSSLLLIQPLAHSAGGAEFHSGGRQFASQDDPDWLAIAAWVKAAH
jgi:hypothetical protein